MIPKNRTNGRTVLRVCPEIAVSVGSTSSPPRKPGSRSWRQDCIPVSSIATLVRGRSLSAVCVVSLMLIGGGWWNMAWSQGRSRAECNACCEKSGLDDYYTEDCKLKCFRNHDHCTGKKAGPAADSVKPAEPKPQPEPSRPAPPTREQRRVREQPPPAPRRPPPAPPFRWPETLVLSPGNEFQSAAQILAANGIPQQHPNHIRAAQHIQGLLMQFGRANPQGGDLPTEELERIIRQYR